MAKTITLRLIKGEFCRLPDREWQYSMKRAAMKRAYYLAKIFSAEVKITEDVITVDATDYYRPTSEAERKYWVD